MCNLILKYQYYIKSFVCAYLCIFSILLQLWDARLRSVVPRWHHWWSESFGFRSERRQGGRTLPCWSGQDRYCGLSSSPVWMLSCVFSVCCVCFPVRRSHRLLPGLHSPPQPQWGRSLRADQTTSLHPDPGADQPGVQLRSPARHAAGPVPRPEPAARRPVHPAALPESTGAAAARPGGARTQIHAKGQDWTLVLSPWTQLAGLQNALSRPPGGVPPVCAALLPGPGSSCSSRGPCRAGEEVSSEGSEQDGEGDPGDQTLPTPAKWKQQEFMGRVSDLLGWPLGVSGEEERAVGQQAQLQWLWPQQAQNAGGLTFTLSLQVCEWKARAARDHFPISFEGHWMESIWQPNNGETLVHAGSDKSWSEAS